MTSSLLINWLQRKMEFLKKNSPRNSGFEPNYTTIHVGLINGGTALNIISKNCEFFWDIRNIPENNPKEILKEFENFCQNEILPKMKNISEDCDIETKELVNTPGLIHESKSNAVNLAKLLSGNKNTSKVPYAAEAGLFQKSGFSTVICGPGSIDQAHKPNEYIEYSQIKKGENFIDNLIKMFSK